LRLVAAEVFDVESENLVNTIKDMQTASGVE